MNTKTLITFLAGATVGVIAGMYLASEEGRPVRDKLKKTLDGLGDAFAEGKDKFGDLASDLINGVKKEAGATDKGAV